MELSSGVVLNNHYRLKVIVNVCMYALLRHLVTLRHHNHQTRKKTRTTVSIYGLF